jgi:pimeloyl-ACP methyl ester carboxylesterase
MRNTFCRTHRLALGLAAAALLLFGCADQGGRREASRPAVTPATRAVTPPAQPARGPGGSQRRHAGARRTDLGGASGPVAIIVIFLDRPFRGVSLQQRRAGTVAGLRAALRELTRPGHVRPQLDAVVLVGHSIGAVMAAQLAADASGQRLPRPRAVFALQPPQEDESGLVLLRRIPPSTLMLVLVSDQDNRVGEDGARALWAAVGHLPAANRDYVRVRSNQRGQVALRADHLLPLSSAGNPPDALDFFGPWKLLDGLQRCATLRRDCQFAMGGTERQRFMGRWSDGTPVPPLETGGP